MSADKKNAISKYIEEITDTPLLSDEQERLLAQRIHEGDTTAISELVDCCRWIPERTYFRCRDANAIHARCRNGFNVFSKYQWSRQRYRWYIGIVCWINCIVYSRFKSLEI